MRATCWLVSSLYPHGPAAQKVPRTSPKRKLFLCALFLSWERLRVLSPPRGASEGEECVVARGGPGQLPNPDCHTPESH